MTWIKTLPLQQADASLRALYQRIAGKSGQVDNILQAHSLRPHSLEGHMALYKSVLHHAGNKLPRWLLEAIGVYVSRLNRCAYCDLHHSEGLRLRLKDETRFERLSEELSKTHPGHPFSAAEQAIFPYVRMLTEQPAAVDQVAVDSLRQAGYSDGEILEINQVSAYFAYANRTVLGLGVDAAGEVLGLSPGNKADTGDWRHD